MKKLLLTLTFALWPALAWAQCNGVFPANTLCGNLTGSPQPPAAFSAGGTTVGPATSTPSDFVLWGNSNGTQLIDAPGTNAILFTGNFNASGSAQATSGFINAASTTLTISSAIDFKNNEGIIINHAGANLTTRQATGISIATVGVSGSTAYGYRISSLDANGGVGPATANVSVTTANASLTATNYNDITWSAPGAGPTPAGYAIFRGGTLVGFAWSTEFWDTGSFIDTTNPPFWIPSSTVTTSLNDWLLTSITAGGGTTNLTLANAATNTASPAVVVHEDSVAIQNAINALPVNGGKVILTGISGNNFNIGQVVTVGNATTSQYSTVSGVKIAAIPIPAGGLNQFNTPVGTLWNELGPHSYLFFNGPLSGWGVDNVSFVCNDMLYGLAVTSAKDGDSNNLAMFNCTGDGLISNSQPSGPFGGNNADSLHNNYKHISIKVPQGSTTRTAGILVAGDAGGSSDTDYNVFSDVFCTSAGGVGLAQCIEQQVADSNVFIGVQCNTSSNAGILFNYSANAGFPVGESFFTVDCASITNSGAAPGNGAVAAPNKLYGFSNANANRCPTNLPNLWCDGRQWVQVAGCNLTGPANTTCTTTVNWQTGFLDLTYVPTCTIVTSNTTSPIVITSIQKSAIGSMSVAQTALTSGTNLSGVLNCSAWEN